MSFFVFVALLFGALCVCSRVQAHVDILVVACQTGNIDPEDEKELDGDELFYVDLKKKEWVGTMPDFLQQWDGRNFVQAALAAQQVCKNSLDVLVKAEQNPPEEIDLPQVTVYPRDEVSLGGSNTLICFANNFFPPPVKVKWTKNDVEVTEGVTLSRYYPNKDLTFRQYSTVPIIPQEGDVYSCTVEHKGFPEPETRLWDVEIQEASDIGKTVFCGVGLTLGLLGVGVGTFFLIKGNNCN
ncbi:H-2 class II histocompatibility antigen, A-U alpha chain-like [Scleropages formosus]|uniref:H-2 class II histocompatibility antigen, A-U alpha chain-like n=1 Tax=Scleropages formosus TaxID=113540 RepID=A0A8C9V588_SCLFO|nr:H-2 class II histocompatibility antigen, A-U alpha chain-like [Scleropages formosus]XP_029101753.1 H-2 class II histocompatibility antigen, A-U alpha chain-like [Scleropages formosus]